MPEIGLDFGHVSVDNAGKLTSDKTTSTLEHVDLEKFARTMTAVEAGVADPMLAVKFTMSSLLQMSKESGSDSAAVPNVSASGKVKGVLVGMPIAQNLWA